MGSENASDISQLMRRCVEHFGPPLAVVRDLSPNIEKAKREAMPNVPDLICHYHFLENVGEKLCEEPHAKLGNALRRLVGHVIEREGQEPFIVCRTNNPAEHRFQVTKRGIRRKVGSKKLTRQIQAMRAEALLVWNLTDQKYIQLVLDGNLANLPAAIAAHWQAAQVIRQQGQTPPAEYPIPTTKKQIRDPNLLDNIKTIATKLINLMKKPAHAA